MGPGESSFLLLLYSTPSCITLLYWSLGSIVVSACVRISPSYIHPATKGHFISHLSQRPVSLKSRHTHFCFKISPSSTKLVQQTSSPFVTVCLVFFVKQLCVFLFSGTLHMWRGIKTPGSWNVMCSAVTHQPKPSPPACTRSAPGWVVQAGGGSRHRRLTLADGCDEASQVVGQMFSLPLNIKAHGEENVVLMDFNFFIMFLKAQNYSARKLILKPIKQKN